MVACPGRSWSSSICPGCSRTPDCLKAFPFAAPATEPLYLVAR